MTISIVARLYDNEDTEMSVETELATLTAATRGITDFFIRAFTWSKWSHVALLLEDNTVIEATYP